MHPNRSQYDNLYRLVIGDNGSEGAHVVEFEGRGPEAALLWASRHCPGHDVEVFENGRSLGVLRNEAGGGFWIILAPTVGAKHSAPGAADYAPRGVTIERVADRHLG